MLQQPRTGGLGAPAQGRSRYSKALPAVPGLGLDEAPALPPLSSLPIPPPRADDSFGKSNTSQQPGSNGGSYRPPVSAESHTTGTLPPSMPSIFTSQEALLSASAQSGGSLSKSAIPRKPIRKPVPQPSQKPASQTSTASSSIPQVTSRQASPPRGPYSQPRMPGSTGTADTTATASLVSPVNAMSSPGPTHAASLSPPLPSPMPPSPSATLSSILSAYSRSTYGNDAEEDGEEIVRASYGTATTDSTGSYRNSGGTATAESKRSTGLSSAGISNTRGSGDGSNTSKITPAPAISHINQLPSMQGQGVSGNWSNNGAGKSPAYYSANSLPTAPGLAQGLGIMHRREESGSGLENAIVAPRRIPDRSLYQSPPSEANVQRTSPVEALDNRSTAANSSSGSLPPSSIPEVPSKIASSFSDPASEERIWRRRSLTGSRDLLNLKLDFSNGSTAGSNAPSNLGSSSTSQRPRQSRGSLESERDKELPSPPQPSRLPELPAEAHGRSGRERPDVPPKEPSPPPVHGLDASAMGNEGSKLKHQLKEKLPSSHDRKDSSSTKSERTLRPSTNRPPTPEYRKEDVKTPIVETCDAPVSPASSPEPTLSAPRNDSKSSLSGDTVKPELDEQVPPTSEQPKRVARKAVPEAALLPPPPVNANALHTARSLPDLKGQTPPPHERPPMPGYGAAYARRESTSSEAGPPGRPRQPADTARFHPRGTSARPDGRMPVEHSGRSTPTPGMDPRMVHSEDKGWQYRGRDGTLYAEMSALAEPDPRAFEFPMQKHLQPIAEGFVIDAPPVRRCHYDCFHKHKTMRRWTNKRHPIACQTCSKADSEDRWTCAFCNLRICEDCLHLLDSKKRDLASLMEELRSNPSLSLSSEVRPTSALGLQFNP